MIAYKTIALLTISNIFMTFAWYGHLKGFKNSSVFLVILASWGLAFFEYLFQVPANRIGHGTFTLPQLKIMQEVIALTVFMPFAYFYMKSDIGINYLYASLCILGAVYFIFRG